MGDRRADALVILGLALYAAVLGYVFLHDAGAAAIGAILVALTAIAAVHWLSD